VSVRVAPPPAGTKRILSIDGGSSSVKIAVYEVGVEHSTLLLDGSVEPLGSPAATLAISDRRAPITQLTRFALRGRPPVAALLGAVEAANIRADAVGHRIVYGGPSLEAPTRVTPAFMTTLDALVPFDPLHLPAALEAIRQIAALLPDVPQVVCFDTAFHHRMPMVAQRLPLPRELWSEGVQRFGFHGLSYESIVRGLGTAGVRGRMIVAHLGNGASMAAMIDGSPIDTTMGFSPLGGLMMGTRPGDLDPGVVLYLLRQGRTPDQLSELLTQRSGLLGVSGLSSDMRTLLDRRGDSVAAAEAIELFVYEAVKNAGGLAAILQGVDTFVFTGGIGENAAPVRAEIAAGLAFLGVTLDRERNERNADPISSDDSRVVVRVIPTAEMLMVALHANDVAFGLVTATQQ
jgi:acetate kinase